ncbi:MAG: hypothetical protein ACTHK1_08210 [Actinomycetales bacterium]
MRHPTDGTIRRLLDEPAGVSDADRTHLAGCPRCAAALEAAREDAVIAQSVLPEAVPALDTDAAWERLSRSLSQDPVTVAVPPAPTRPERRRRGGGLPRLRRPVVAAVSAVVLLTGASAAAAAEWLPIFHTERVAPVSLSEGDLVQLPDLSAVGTLTVTTPPAIRDVPDAAAAQRLTGIAAPQLATLPHGVVGDPSFQASPAASATFTFSAAKAAQVAAASGTSVPPVPPGLDGSQFRLTAGPGVAEVWRDARGVPALIVGRAGAPEVASSGVAFDRVRDYLLSLPSLPGGLRAQLRAYTADSSTLPLPLPSGLASTSTADVDGSEATVIASRDGLLHAVVWVRDGEVLAVAGSVSADEVLEVARTLRLPS